MNNNDDCSVKAGFNRFPLKRIISVTGGINSSISKNSQGKYFINTVSPALDYITGVHIEILIDTAHGVKEYALFLSDAEKFLEEYDRLTSEKTNNGKSK